MREAQGCDTGSQGTTTHIRVDHEADVGQEAGPDNAHSHQSTSSSDASLPGIP